MNYIDYADQSSFLIECHKLACANLLAHPQSTQPLHAKAFQLTHSSGVVGDAPDSEENRKFCYDHTYFKCSSEPLVIERLRSNLHRSAKQEFANSAQYLLMLLLMNTCPFATSYEEWLVQYEFAIKHVRSYVIQRLSPYDPNEQFDALAFHSQTKDAPSFLVVWEQKKASFFTFDKEHAQDIINWAVARACNAPITPTQTITALRDLWIYQLTQSGVQTPTSQSEFQLKLNHFFYEFLQAGYNHSLNQKTKVSFTFKDVCDFLIELSAGKLTTATANVQQWLECHTDDKSFNDYLSVIAKHDAFDRLNESISLAPSKDAKWLLNEFHKDKAFNSRFKIGKILKVSYKNDTRKGDSTFWGIHGTKQISLNSILLNGFKTNDELYRSSNKNYRYTASGLGDGIYFAQLYQLNKSANYTGSQQSTYLFVCSVKYNKDKVYTTSSYQNGLKADGYEMVYGKRVGTGGIDEMVAKYSSAVRVEYLVEITREN